MEGFIKKTIGGISRGFQFDLKAFGLILNSLDVKLLDLNKVIVENPFFSYPIILFHGALRAAEKNKEEITFTQDDVYEWIGKEEDGVLSAPILEIIKVFSESSVGLMPKKVQEGKEVPNGGKKAPKSTGKGT